MRTIAATILLAALAACGSEPAETTEADSRFTIERDGDATQVRATGDNGEEVVVNAGDGAAGTVDLPLGFTVYPGAKVVSNSNITTNDGSGSVLFMTTADSPAEVVAFYRRQAEAAGLTIATQSTNNNAQTMTGEGTGGRNFMMTATTSGDDTGVQLMVGQAPGG